MRAVAGFAGFHLILAASGAALLYALGLVRAEPRELAASAGPSFFCGAALVVPLQIALLVLGVPVSVVTFALTALGITVVLLVVGARLRRDEPPGPEVERRDPPDRVEVWAVRVAIVALAVFLLLGARGFANLPTVFDDAGIWSVKAQALFFYDSLDTEMFKDAAYLTSQLDYPLLQPLFEADLYRAMGNLDLQLVHVELWVLFASFLWTVAFLLRGSGRPLARLAPVCALAVAPGVYEQIKIGYADVTVSCFAAAGVLCVGLWLERGRSGHLFLGAVLLAAAVNTKNEGIAAAAAASVACAVVLLGARRRPPLVPVLGAAAVALAASLPWRIWAARPDPVGPDVSGPVTDGGTSAPLGSVTGGTDRLGEALDGVGSQLSLQGRWMWIVPAAIAVAAASFFYVRDRRVPAFYLMSGLLILGALVWVYWTGEGNLRAELIATVDRTITGTVFVAMVAAAHLLSVRRREAAPDD